MKRIVLGFLLLFVSGLPALADYPFEGQWSFDCSLPVGDMVPTIIEPGQITYHESECTIDEVSPIGKRDQVWSVGLSCAGEGETWNRTAILAIDPDPNGEASQLVEIDLDLGYALIRDRCE